MTLPFCFKAVVALDCMKGAVEYKRCPKHVNNTRRELSRFLKLEANNFCVWFGYF